MALKMKKAVREQVFSKVLLGGVAGSGKSYSALLLAKGMADETEKRTGKRPKIGMLSTEGGRSLLYADVVDYDLAELEEPFTPESMIEDLATLEEEGYGIIIIDSLSAFWSGSGGILQIVQSMGGNNMQAWAKCTPRFNQMMNAIVKANMHIIACVRGKDTWEIDKDQNGKTSVKKLSQGLDFRANADYEFMASFMIDQQTHVATVSKDNMRIFTAMIRPLNESDGVAIIKWCTEGERPTTLPKPIGSAEAKAEQEKLFAETREKIKEIALAMNKEGRSADYQKVVELFLPNKKVMECTVEDLPSMIKILDGLVQVTN